MTGPRIVCRQVAHNNGRIVCQHPAHNRARIVCYILVCFRWSKRRDPLICSTDPSMGPTGVRGSALAKDDPAITGSSPLPGPPMIRTAGNLSTAPAASLRDRAGKRAAVDRTAGGAVTPRLSVSGEDWPDPETRQPSRSSRTRGVAAGARWYSQV